MSWYEAIMWIPSVLIVLAFVPQMISTIKSKKTDGISPISYSLVFIGTFLLMGWAGFTGMFVVSIYISNFILALVEIVIMFYIFKNINKMYIFFILISIFVIVFVLTTINLFGPTLIEHNDLFLSIFMALGVGFIGFAFAPQTVSSLIKKEVGHVSISTATLIFVSNIIFAIGYIGFYTSGETAGNIDKLIGAIGSIIGASWQAPQILLKIYLNKNTK